MLKTIHSETHNGVLMEVIQKETKQEPKHASVEPPPSFDSTHSPLKEPHGEKPEFDHPFIYTTYVNRTVHQLLQIADQSEHGYYEPQYFYFPPNLAVYDPDLQSSQWSAKAHYMGKPLEYSPNPYLANNGGLTFEDRSYIQESFKLGWSLEDIWK
jgi:hypothetical protein